MRRLCRFLQRVAVWRAHGAAFGLALQLAWQARWPISGSAFPVNIDRASPASSDSPGSGDDQLRALKLALQDLFGIPDATNITAALFSLGALTDGKWATDRVVKGASPRHNRLIGTEGSAVDSSWQEDAGVLKLAKNTGTEASPTWTVVLEIALATGNLSWYSGETFKVTFDHAVTADRTVTFPDRNLTLEDAGMSILKAQVFS